MRLTVGVCNDTYWLLNFLNNAVSQEPSNSQSNHEAFAQHVSEEKKAAAVISSQPANNNNAIHSSIPVRPTYASVIGSQPLVAPTQSVSSENSANRASLMQQNANMNNQEKESDWLEALVQALLSAPTDNNIVK